MELLERAYSWCMNSTLHVQLAVSFQGQEVKDQALVKLRHGKWAITDDFQPWSSAPLSPVPRSNAHPVTCPSGAQVPPPLRSIVPQRTQYAPSMRTNVQCEVPILVLYHARSTALIYHIKRGGQFFLN